MKMVPPAGEHLEVAFSLGDARGEQGERALHLGARVRRRNRLQDGRYGLGLEFTELSARDQEVLERYILRQVLNNIVEVVERQTMNLEPSELEHHGDRIRILEHLEEMRRNQARLELFQRGADAIFSGVIGEITQTSIRIDLGEPGFSDPPSDRVHCSCTQGHINFYFHSSLQSVEGDSLYIAVPSGLFSYDSRRTPRKELEHGKAYIEIPLPYPVGSVLVRPVLDISSEGLAFSTPVDQSYFLPQTPLPELRILRQGEERPLTRSGVVMHVTPIEVQGRTELKIGVQFGRHNVALTARKPGAAASPTSSFFSKMTGFIRHLALKTFGRSKKVQAIQEPQAVEIVRYANRKREEIVGILNATGQPSERLHAPLVIVPPAHGKRKESASALALALLENFQRRKKDIVVLRYDGIRMPGESYKDPETNQPGEEALNWTLSQALSDLEATLDYAYDNPRFYPTEVIVVSPSIQAVPVRRLLAEDTERRVHFWISLMGVPAAQEVIRNGTGGIDYVANYARGIPLGHRQFLGVMIDADHFCQDLLGQGMAFMSDALIDMSRIDIPITWLAGKHDAWIDPHSIQELLAHAPSTDKELVTLNVGHIPLNGEEAFDCFNTMIRSIWRFLYQEEISPVPPSMQEVKRVRALEWARTPRVKLKDRHKFWHNFMIGDGPSSACYDIYEFFDEYRSFIRQEIELLELKPGHHLADMGCGIGNLPCFLLERYGGRTAWQLGGITLVDFLAPALDKAQARLDKIARNAGKPLPPITKKVVNLQMSPLRKLERFLKGEFYAYDPLKGLLPGISDYSVEVWKRLADWRLHGILRGRPITPDDQAFMAEKLPPEEQRVLRDFNRLARFVQGRTLPEDVDSVMCDDGRLPVLQRQTEMLKYLKFDALQPGAVERLTDRLPFPDESFDRIVCSLVLSYLDHPGETLSEYVRCLKPGGRIVFSSMKPDTDPGEAYQKALRKLESNDYVELPEGFSRQTLIESIRAFINSGALLIQLAEEMQFRFFSRDEMRELAEYAGLTRVEIYPSYGERPQAYIAVGYK